MVHKEQKDKLRVCLKTILENSFMFFGIKNSFLTEKIHFPYFWQKKKVSRICSKNRLFLEQIWGHFKTIKEMENTLGTFVLYISVLYLHGGQAKYIYIYIYFSYWSSQKLFFWQLLSKILPDPKVANKIHKITSKNKHTSYG